MRIIAIPLLLLCALPGYSQLQVHISPPISVTNNSSVYGKHLPRVELLNDGSPLVFWSKSGAVPQLYLAIMEDGVFSNPIQVPTGSVSPNVWGGALGPDIAVRDSMIFAVFEKYGDAIYIVKSTDRGESFTVPVVAYEPPPGHYATLPTIFIDEDHNPLVAFITTIASEQEAESMVTISSDGGSTFGPAVSASEPADGTEVCECCPSGLLVDNEGDIYFSFRNNNVNIRDIWVSRSADNGQSFPVAVDIDETNWFIQGCPSTGPQSFDMGTGLVSVFFSGAAGWPSGIYMSTIEKASMTSGPVSRLPSIDSSANNQNYPRIAGNGDTLGVVWQESIAGNMEIVMAYSTNGPEGLMENISNISDTVSSQTYPDITYRNGQFHIVYEDQLTGTILYRVASFQEPVNVQHLEMPVKRLSVYPNPVSDVLTVSVDESRVSDELVIADLMGREVCRVRIESKEFTLSVPVLGLAPGAYFCRLGAEPYGQATTLIVK